MHAWHPEWVFRIGIEGRQCRRRRIGMAAWHRARGWQESQSVAVEEAARRHGYGRGCAWGEGSPSRTDAAL